MHYFRHTMSLRLLSLSSGHKKCPIENNRASHIIHQNLAVILRQFYNGKISFIFLVSGGWPPKTSLRDSRIQNWPASTSSNQIFWTQWDLTTKDLVPNNVVKMMKPLRAFQENPVLTDSAEFISSSSDETSKRHKVFNTFWPAAASALAVSQGSTSLEGPDTQHEKSISMVKTVRTFLAQPVLTSSLQSRPASDSVGRKSKPYRALVDFEIPTSSVETKVQKSPDKKGSSADGKI